VKEWDSTISTNAVGIAAQLFMGSLSVEMRRKNGEEQEGLDQMGMRPKKHKELRK
jgi:DNA-binding transcriptional regulator of glucitol operon